MCRGVVFHAYQKPIATYLSHLLGEAERVEELAQEAFLHAYRAMVKGIEVEQPKAWLYRIATNARGEQRVNEEGSCR